MEDILKLWIACQGDMKASEFISLISKFDSAQKALEALQKHLSTAEASVENGNGNGEYFRDFRPKLLSALDVRISDRFLKEFKNSYERFGIKGITILDSEYPDLLREIQDPPPVLFIKGQWPLILDNSTLTIAMVGSRESSEYGTRAAEALAHGLAEKGAVVVSGMARGIDCAAHRGALDGGGKTIAVLGSGLLNVYPKSNLSIFERISTNGAILSEFPPNLKAKPFNFPRRNRIISGMSRGVVVVEAGMKSGSLITVDYALSQGRDVFAVPGNINSLSSKGSNFLIKQGAKIVLCPSDILEEYGVIEEDGRWGGEVKDRNMLSNIEKDEKIPLAYKKICKLLIKKSLSLDELSNALDETACDLLNSMVEMEMTGLVYKLQGRYILSSF